MKNGKMLIRLSLVLALIVMGATALLVNGGDILSIVAFPIRGGSP